MHRTIKLHFTWDHEDFNKNYVRSEMLNINMSGEGLCIKIILFTRLKFRRSVLENLILATTHVHFTLGVWPLNNINDKICACMSQVLTCENINFNKSPFCL